MQQSQEENIKDDITKLQEEYYEKNNKHFFFKKSQKYDCASVITQHLDVKTLFEKTLYVIKENEIFFDYTLFKTYIYPEIYDAFLEYINVISFEYIDKMPEYSLHLNFQSLSITAFERYWPLVKQIMNKFPVHGNKMQKTYIYYTPNVVDQIMKVMYPFISHFREKIVFYTKMESPEKIGYLFNFNKKI
jgi:hypothetical protein